MSFDFRLSTFDFRLSTFNFHVKSINSLTFAVITPPAPGIAAPVAAPVEQHVIVPPPPAPVEHHAVASSAAKSEETHAVEKHTETSGTATPAPSTRTNVTQMTATSLADLPTPTEIFIGHVAEHATTLMMRDGQIFDDSGETLFRIDGRKFTDKQHAPVFNLRRGHFRRRMWKVKPIGSKKLLRIRAREHYGFFWVPMPPESTSGAKGRETVLHANQLRLGAAKSAFESKAIVGMVEDDKMHVAKGFDLALAGALWKAQTDTLVKHERHLHAWHQWKVKRAGKIKVKSTKSSKSSAATV